MSSAWRAGSERSVEARDDARSRRPSRRQYQLLQIARKCKRHYILCEAPWEVLLIALNSCDVIAVLSRGLHVELLVSARELQLRWSIDGTLCQGGGGWQMRCAVRGASSFLL